MLCNHALASCCINEMTNFRGEKREPFLGNDKRLVNKERGKKNPNKTKTKKKTKTNPNPKRGSLEIYFLQPSPILFVFALEHLSD